MNPLLETLIRCIRENDIESLSSLVQQQQQQDPLSSSSSSSSSSIIATVASDGEGIMLSLDLSSIMSIWAYDDCMALSQALGVNASIRQLELFMPSSIIRSSTSSSMINDGLVYDDNNNNNDDDDESFTTKTILRHCSNNAKLFDDDDDYDPMFDETGRTLNSNDDDDDENNDDDDDEMSSSCCCLFDFLKYNTAIQSLLVHQVSTRDMFQNLINNLSYVQKQRESDPFTLLEDESRTYLEELHLEWIVPPRRRKKKKTRTRGRSTTTTTMSHDHPSVRQQRDLYTAIRGLDRVSLVNCCFDIATSDDDEDSAAYHMLHPTNWKELSLVGCGDHLTSSSFVRTWYHQCCPHLRSLKLINCRSSSSTSSSSSTTSSSSTLLSRATSSCSSFLLHDDEYENDDLTNVWSVFSEQPHVSLQQLDISSNDWTVDDCSRIIAPWLDSCPSLIELRCADNPRMGTRGVQQICTTFSHTLLRLDVAGCQITSVGLESITETFFFLQDINVSQNPITDLSCLAYHHETWREVVLESMVCGLDDTSLSAWIRPNDPSSGTSLSSLTTTTSSTDASTTTASTATTSMTTTGYVRPPNKREQHQYHHHHHHSSPSGAGGPPQRLNLSGNVLGKQTLHALSELLYDPNIKMEVTTTTSSSSSKSKRRHSHKKQQQQQQKSPLQVLILAECQLNDYDILQLFQSCCDRRQQQEQQQQEHDDQEMNESITTKQRVLPWTELHLPYNQIGQLGADCIAQVIQDGCLPYLTTLSLEGNPVWMNYENNLIDDDDDFVVHDEIVPANVDPTGPNSNHQEEYCYDPDDAFTTMQRRQEDQHQQEAQQDVSTNHMTMTVLTDHEIKGLGDDTTTTTAATTPTVASNATTPTSPNTVMLVDIDNILLQQAQAPVPPPSSAVKIKLSSHEEASPTPMTSHDKHHHHHDNNNDDGVDDVDESMPVSTLWPSDGISHPN